MAIDDNTLYGLTGAQVKELPERIEAVKGLARELTAEDYNFHTSGDTDNMIALWLLPPGIYCWNRDLNQNILLTRSQSVTFSGNGMGAIVMDGHSYKPILLFNEPSQGFGLNYWEVSSGGYSGNGKWVSFSLVDNLTTDHGYEALSAKQGKVLKDLIDSIAIRGAGAPTTSTVGQVGTLYEDTTNGKLYICTDTTGGTYTWEEIGAGGGGPTVVQTTGTSQTDVMSQNAVTSMVFKNSNLDIVRIGTASNASNTYGVAIGANADSSQGARAVAIGVRASATASDSVAIGRYSAATVQGQFDIGNSNGGAYNNSNYRLLTGLYDGQNAHDAATYGQVISYSAINGAGAPTTATEGKYVGQLYYDTTNEAMYFLKTIDTTTTPATYTWEALGGSSVNVVQSPGTSRTDVMSQYAATKLVYPDYSSTVLKAIKITGSTSSSAHSEEVTIGYGVSANAGRAAVGVGYQANNNGNRSVAIGNYARATADGSIAIGEGAYASTRGEMNIGTSTSASYGTSYGYNNTAYRLLTGLYDPQSDHDAATKGYVDNSLLGKQDVLTAGSGISIADESGSLVISTTVAEPDEFTSSEWNALWS